MTENLSPEHRKALDAGHCPLCGLAWTAKNIAPWCEHEADWYRAWLAYLTELTPNPSGGERDE